MLKEQTIFPGYQLLYQEAKEALIWRIQKAKKNNLLTPEVIYDYAALMLQDDDKLPIIPADHHKIWMEYICNDDIKKLLIISPPGSAKTTWLIQAYLGCRLGFYPDQNYIIGSVTDEVAEKRSLSLRGDVESDLWNEIFPDVVKNNKQKWEQTEWSIKSDGSIFTGRLHPTVRAYGVGSSSIGGRADILFGDDLLSKENTYTQGQRSKVADWVESSFLTRKKPQGRILLIGTAWNAADYYAKLRKEPKGWTIIHCSSYQEDGFFIYIHHPDKSNEEVHIHNEKVLWNEHQTEAETLSIKNTTQEHIWQTTWQGYPTAPAGKLFQREWWDGKNRYNSGGDIIARWLSLDTGLSDTEGSAKSALVVFELLSDYRIQVADVWSGKVQYPQLVSKTIEFAVKYNIHGLLHGIIIENKASGISLIQTLRQSAPEEIRTLIKSYNPKVSKELRWGESAVWCSLDCVLLPNPSPEFRWLYELERDLFDAPDVEYRDVLDAFAQGVLFLDNYLSENYKSRIN